MTDVRQLQEDLSYVRQAVARRGRPAPGPASIYWVWGIYVLVGYTLNGFWPDVAGWFFMAGGIVGGIASWYLGKRYALRAGEYDMAEVRRRYIHWIGGIFLSLAGAFALASVIPELRGFHIGQLVVVMIGLVYFLAGAHWDRNLLWLGLVLMAGGVVVGQFPPRYGWSVLGVVIFLGLVVPTLLPRRQVDGAAS